MKVEALIEHLRKCYNAEDDIAVSIWSIEDVQSLDSNLTCVEAAEILENIQNNEDATIGINWDVIQCHIDMRK